MPTHYQFYLTCSKCEKQFVGEDGDRFGETEEEIRDLAVDEGWSCYRGMSEDEDYCPEHRPSESNVQGLTDYDS